MAPQNKQKYLEEVKGTRTLLLQGEAEKAVTVQLEEEEGAKLQVLFGGAPCQDGDHGHKL